MPVFLYRAMDSSQRSQLGRVWGLDQQHARQQLERLGFQHIFLKPGPLWDSWWESARPPSAWERVMVCRQLALLLKSGVPISRALDILLRQPLDRRLYRAYQRCQQEVHEGQPLSQAMQHSPDQFNGLLVGLVQVGESTGQLAENLQQAAEHMEKELMLRKKVEAALTYPLIVSAMSLTVAYLIVQHILPRFINGLFASGGLTLPWYTRLLVGLTEALQQPHIWGGGLLVGLTLLALGYQYFRTEAGLLVLYESLLRWRFTRSFFGRVLALRLSRLLSTALGAGLSALAALELTAEACANPYLAQYLRTAAEDLQDGNPISQCFRAIPFLPPCFHGFVDLGEQTAKLPDALSRSSQMLELEIDEVIVTFTQMLEPLLVGALGLFVGFVLVSLFVPLYQVLGAVA